MTPPHPCPLSDPKGVSAFAPSQLTIPQTTETPLPPGSLQSPSCQSRRSFWVSPRNPLPYSPPVLASGLPPICPLSSCSILTSRATLHSPSAFHLLRWLLFAPRSGRAQLFLGFHHCTPLGASHACGFSQVVSARVQTHRLGCRLDPRPHSSASNHGVILASPPASSLPCAISSMLLQPHCYLPRQVLSTFHFIGSVSLPYSPPVFLTAARATFLQHNSDPVVPLLKTFTASLVP